MPGGHLERQATIADGEHVFRPDRLWSARLKKDTQMTSKKGDGLLDHAKRVIDNWSKADFLHQAQILARRLTDWHVDDSGPVWTPKEIDFRREVEQSFRHRIMLGEHEFSKKFASSTLLIPIPPTGNFDNDVVGQAVALHPEEYRKDETIWFLRDFYEHLGQLGDSDTEKLLRFKFEQLLDSRMYRRAHSDVFGDYIAGYQVNQSLLDELVNAAKLSFEMPEHPRHCNACGQPLIGRDYDRSECNDCRSRQGKLLDLYVAIHAIGDTPDRIREWPLIRALLRVTFGPDRPPEELWELMTDRLQVNGWDEERWLRTRYGDFIAMLKSGLFAEQLPAINSTTAKCEEPLQPSIQANSFDACKPSERKAYYSFKLAESRQGRRLEDRDAHTYLLENDCSEQFTGELTDYKVPEFVTWARQLRSARKAANERKYTPRTHR